jgi:hypothetical protein
MKMRVQFMVRPDGDGWKPCAVVLPRGRRKRYFRDLPEDAGDPEVLANFVAEFACDVAANYGVHGPVAVAFHKDGNDLEVSVARRASA